MQIVGDVSGRLVPDCLPQGPGLAGLEDGVCWKDRWLAHRQVKNIFFSPCGKSLMEAEGGGAGFLGYFSGRVLPLDSAQACSWVARASLWTTWWIPPAPWSRASASSRCAVCIRFGCLFSHLSQEDLAKFAPFPTHFEE